MHWFARQKLPAVLTAWCDCGDHKETTIPIGSVRKSSVAVVGLVLLLVAATSACDDPTSVGSGLVEDEPVEPVRLQLIAQQIEPEEITKFTGAVRGDLAFSGAVSNVLTGEVDDPLMGSKRAVGYMDFRRANPQQEFLEEPVDYVALWLDMPYVYGDTTAQNELAIHPISAAWDPTGVPSSETFEAGPEIVRVAFQPSDSLIRVVFPDDWVEENRDLLVSTDFGSNFHGFELRVVNATAVVGFTGTNSALAVGNSVDTLAYVPERLFTHLDATNTFEPPAGFVPVVDGLGRALRLDFDFDTEGSETPVLTRVTLRVPSARDILTADSLSGFVRPLLQQLYLFAVDGEGIRTFLGSTFRANDGTFSFVGTAVSEDATLLSIIQSTLLGSSPFDHFLITAPTNLMSLSPLLVPSTGVDQIPEVVLTFVPA